MIATWMDLTNKCQMDAFGLCLYKKHGEVLPNSFCLLTSTLILHLQRARNMFQVSHRGSQQFPNTETAISNVAVYTPEN